VNPVTYLWVHAGDRLQPLQTQDTPCRKYSNRKMQQQQEEGKLYYCVWKTIFETKKTVVVLISPWRAWTAPQSLKENAAKKRQVARRARTRERERERERRGGVWRAREKTRARERGKTQNDRTLAASEVGRTPGTSSGRVFLFLFLRVDGLGNRWFSVNEGIQPVSALATFPVEVHNNVGPVPSLAGTKKCWSS